MDFITKYKLVVILIIASMLIGGEILGALIVHYSEKEKK
jgi:hypothetical protein